MTIEPRARLRELEKRLKDEPDNLGLRVTVAGVLRELGRVGEAVEQYRTVAIAYRDQGRAQQAIAVCRSILDVAPDDAACKTLLDTLLAPSSPTEMPAEPAAEPATIERVPPASAPAAAPAPAPAPIDPGDLPLTARLPLTPPPKGASNLPETLRSRAASSSSPPLHRTHPPPARTALPFGPPPDRPAAPPVPPAPPAPPVAATPPPASGGDVPTKVATELTNQLAELTSKEVGVNEVPTRVAPDAARAGTPPTGLVGRRPITEQTRTTGGSVEPTKPTALPPSQPANFVGRRPPTEQTRTEPDDAGDAHPTADEPARRSSFDQTPLPGPLPYHVADPTTSSLERISASRLFEAGVSEELLEQLAELRLSDIEIGDEGDGESNPTRPGDKPRVDHSTMRELPITDSSGFASAARRISALVSGSSASDEELVTREVARLDPVDVDAEPAARSRPSNAPAADDAANPRGSAIELSAEDAESIESLEVSSVDDEPHDSEFTSPRDLPMGTGVTRLPDEDTSLVGLDNAFFAPVPVRQRGRAHARFTVRTIKPGAIVIRQGESNHPLVIVVTGRLAVVAERVDGDAIALGFVDDGDFIGEASLLARKPAPAQVIATTDAVVMTLPARDLFELAAAYPLLWSALKDRAEKYNRELETKLRG